MFSGLFSCSEKYNFNVESDRLGLVIESSISNISYNESVQFPSEGRYFKTRLTRTSKVDNVRDIKEKGAKVILADSDGQTWQYNEDKKVAGLYFLNDDLFKVESGKSYQLRIKLEDGPSFESDWETLPNIDNTQGEISFSETNKDLFYWEAGERIIKTRAGVNVQIDVNEGTIEPRFFRWSFDPMWIYKAELTELDSPVRYCWVTSPYELKDFVLQQDNGRDAYHKELFFIATKGNEFVYHYFSALVHQELISEGYYNFWKDFQSQKEKGGLFDQPPYGLPTNYKTTNSDWTVNGYFGVVSENTTRWEFAIDQLSYNVPNNLKEVCEGISDGNDQCVNCLLYNLGTPTNIPPDWWTRDLF
jgi:hypothetical protein